MKITDLLEGNKENKAKKKAVVPPKSRSKSKMSSFDPRTDLKMKESLDERDALPSDNFTADDIKKLERMTDINQMKAFAKELISKPSQRPMKPQKVAWFSKAIDSKRRPMDVIKLMYDLLLGGEGDSVIGSRHSTDPNSYRKTFGEEEKDWTSRYRVGCTLIDRNGPAASQRNKKIFKNVWVRAEDEHEAKKVALYYYRKKGYSVVDTQITTPEESMAEGRMPSSVIKHKQAIANMSPEEKKKKFAGKSVATLKQMAWRHGYGKDSNEYAQHHDGVTKDDVKESITDPNDKRKYDSLRNMEANRLAKAKKSKSPLSQDQHRKMAQQHNDDANKIMDKYRK